MKKITHLIETHDTEHANYLISQGYELLHSYIKETPTAHPANTEKTPVFILAKKK